MAAPLTDISTAGSRSAICSSRLEAPSGSRWPCSQLRTVGALSSFTPAELAERRTGIGASEVPAICGLDRFRTPLDVFLEKTGQLPAFEGNDDTVWGTLIEPVIVMFYVRQFPDRTVTPSPTLRHASIDWAYATPDRMVADGTARWPLECKNRSFFTSHEFGEAGTDEIPDAVAAQGYWQMFVTETDRCDVAAVLGGKPPRFFRLYRDEAVMRNIVELVTAFWEEHVRLGIAPAVGARDGDTLKRLFPASTGTMLDGTADQYEMLRMLCEAKAEAKELEQQIGDLEAPLKMAIAEHDGLAFPDGSKCTWKSAKASGGDRLEGRCRRPRRVRRRRDGRADPAHPHDDQAGEPPVPPRAREGSCLMTTATHHGPGAPGADAPPFPGERPEVHTRQSAADPGLSLQPREAAAPAPQAETSATAVAAREKATIEARFLMAIGRPRNPDQARLRILDACKRPRFAESARYQKPVGNGKKVTGLSVRFAEEAGRAWGNLDVSAMIVFDDAERRIYRVVGVDLETNWSTEQDVIVEKFVERLQVRAGDEVISKRTNSRNETTYRIAASEDALLTKANALVSKAKRNIILDLIPSDVQEEAEEMILATQKRQDAEDPAGARKRLLEAFWTLGVTPADVTALIGKPLEQVNPAELQLLRTVYTAVRDGETTWAEAVTELAGRFGTGAQTSAPPVAAAASGGTEGLRARLDEKVARKKADIEREKGAQAAPAAPSPVSAVDPDLELDQRIAKEEG
ncbi:MAG TPA: YqaJ viral recombinase family protein [Gemmatimonadales bacterium]